MWLYEVSGDWYLHDVYCVEIQCCICNEINAVCWNTFIQNLWTDPLFSKSIFVHPFHSPLTNPIVFRAPQLTNKTENSVFNFVIQCVTQNCYRYESIQLNCVYLLLAWIVTPRHLYIYNKFWKWCVCTIQCISNVIFGIHTKSLHTYITFILSHSTHVNPIFQQSNTRYNQFWFITFS